MHIGRMARYDSRGAIGSWFSGLGMRGNLSKISLFVVWGLC